MTATTGLVWEQPNENFYFDSTNRFELVYSNPIRAWVATDTLAKKQFVDDLQGVKEWCEKRAEGA